MDAGKKNVMRLASSAASVCSLLMLVSDTNTDSSCEVALVCSTMGVMGSTASHASMVWWRRVERHSADCCQRSSNSSRARRGKGRRTRMKDME